MSRRCSRCCKHDFGLFTEFVRLLNSISFKLFLSFLFVKYFRCGIPSVNCPNLSQQRHRHLLTQCLQYIIKFENFFIGDECPDYAIAAQELRNGLRCLAQITGEVSTEEILDVIFKDFCIGK